MKSSFDYAVYGTHVTSDVPFDFPPFVEPGRAMARVRFNAAPPDTPHIAGVPSDHPWFECRPRADGSVHVRWGQFYDFLIDRDGDRVTYRPLAHGTPEILQNFLFGQALSFALVRQGIEPLHAAAVGVGDEAIGFLGDCGFGKSTLAGSFIDAGHRLLTDDLLILDSPAGHAGRPIARAGIGRIKLHPESAGRLLADSARSVRLHPLTTKRVLQLDADQIEAVSLPLRALFVLPAPDERDDCGTVRVTPLAAGALFQHLVKNTFVAEIDDERRLDRHFAFMAGVASSVQGFALAYPAGLDHLHAVRAAILEHLGMAWRVSNEKGVS